MSTVTAPGTPSSPARRAVTAGGRSATAYQIWALPLHTGALLGRYAIPLAFWFVLGNLVHDLLLRGAAWLAHKNQWLGFSGLSLSVLTLLATTIMMVHAVRPGLVSVPARADSTAPWQAPSDVGDRRMVETIAETILPFLIFYGAWGLFTEEVRTWGIHVLNQNMLAGIDIVNVFGSVTGIPLVIAVGSWIVRAICERIYNVGGGRALGMVVALFEANWMFFGVISVSVLVGNGVDWLTSRVAWVEAREVLGAPLELLTSLLPGFTALVQVWSWVNEHYWSHVKDGLLLPLLWLVIVAVVSGEEMNHDARMIAGSRLESAGALFQRLPSRLRVISELFSREVRDKWTPLVNGLRLVLGAGPLFYLTFCLCYTLIEAATGWAFIGATHLIGAHPWEWWWPRLDSLVFVEQGIHEVLRIALLAAAFDICVQRGAHRRATAAVDRLATSTASPRLPSPAPAVVSET